MTAIGLTVSRGSVEMRSDKPMTIEDVTNLAKAAKVAGIPGNAEITNMNFSYGYGQSGQEVLIRIGWDAKRDIAVDR